MNDELENIPKEVVVADPEISPEEPRKAMKNSIRVVNSLAEIRTEYVSKLGPGQYHSTNHLGHDNKRIGKDVKGNCGDINRL
jgi:hypothetical protein